MGVHERRLPLTVTVSSMAPTCIATLTVAVKDAGSSIPLAPDGAKAGERKVTV